MMKRERGNSGIFVEVLFLIVFMLFVSIVLIQLFAAAQKTSALAQDEQGAVLIAQDTCESFTATDGDVEFNDALATLEGTEGLRRDASSIRFTRDGYSVVVMRRNKALGSGSLETAYVTVSREGMDPLEIDASRYVSNNEAEVSR